MQYQRPHLYILLQSLAAIVCCCLVSITVMASLILAHNWSVHPVFPDCTDTRPLEMTMVFTLIYGVMLLLTLRGPQALRAFYVFGLAAIIMAGLSLLLTRVAPVAPPMQAVAIVVWSYAATGFDLRRARRDV